MKKFLITILSGLFSLSLFAAQYELDTTGTEYENYMCSYDDTNHSVLCFVNPSKKTSLQSRKLAEGTYLNNVIEKENQTKDKKNLIGRFAKTYPEKRQVREHFVYKR